MSRHFIQGRDELLLPWAASRMTHVGDPSMFGLAASLGIATGPTKSDRLLAVVVYHQFVPQYHSCMISMAAANAHWCDRGTIKTILSIPFYQYNCNRVWVAIPHTNVRLIKFLDRTHVGFTREGVMRDAFGPKCHCVVMGMLRREFENRYVRNGKEFPVAATGT